MHTSPGCAMPAIEQGSTHGLESAIGLSRFPQPWLWSGEPPVIFLPPSMPTAYPEVSGAQSVRERVLWIRSQMARLGLTYRGLRQC